MKVRFPKGDNVNKVKCIEDIGAGVSFSYKGIVFMKLDSEFLKRWLDVEIEEQGRKIPVINCAVRLSAISTIPEELIREIDETTSYNCDVVFPIKARVNAFKLGVEVDYSGEFECVHKSLISPAEAAASKEQ